MVLGMPHPGRSAKSRSYPTASSPVRKRGYTYVEAMLVDRDGAAAATFEARMRYLYARRGQASFDERSLKLATFAV